MNKHNSTSLRPFVVALAVTLAAASWMRDALAEEAPRVQRLPAVSVAAEQPPLDPIP